MSIAGAPVSRLVGALVSNGTRLKMTRWERATLELSYDPTTNPFAIALGIAEGPWSMAPCAIDRGFVADAIRRSDFQWYGVNCYWLRNTRGGGVEFAFDSMDYRVRPIVWQFTAFMAATRRSVPIGEESMPGLDAAIERMLSEPA